MHYSLNILDLRKFCEKYNFLKIYARREELNYKIISPCRRGSRITQRGRREEEEREREKEEEENSFLPVEGRQQRNITNCDAERKNSSSSSTLRISVPLTFSLSLSLLFDVWSSWCIELCPRGRSPSRAPRRPPPPHLTSDRDVTWLAAVSAAREIRSRGSERASEEARDDVVRDDSRAPVDVTVIRGRGRESGAARCRRRRRRRSTSRVTMSTDPRLSSLLVSSTLLCKRFASFVLSFEKLGADP